MELSYSEQFVALVKELGTQAASYLCDGASTSAMIWDDDSEVTIRLSLRDDEIWLIAGAGILLRFVADSDGEFDREGIAFVIDQILRGAAIEFFGVANHVGGEDIFATGYEIGPKREFAGGLNETQARFRARLAGPLARARLIILDS